MVIYYALGGGLGHITRARKVLKALDIPQAKVVTATANVPYDLCAPEHLLTVPRRWSMQPKKLCNQLKKWLHQNQASRLLIDTFPTGIKGEINFSDFASELRIDYVARYVHWPAYRNVLAPGARFNTSYLIEALSPDQSQFVKNTSSSVAELSLPLIESRQTKQTDYPASASTQRSYWLIVHSGPSHEVKELLYYANDIAKNENMSPNLVVCTQIPTADLLEDLSQALVFEKIEIVSLYPAWPLFKDAEKIISAAGFNTIHETRTYSAKHHVLPFERRYDDQFLRLAGRLNSSTLNTQKAAN